MTSERIDMDEPYGPGFYESPEHFVQTKPVEKTLHCAGCTGVDYLGRPCRGRTSPARIDEGMKQELRNHLSFLHWVVRTIDRRPPVTAVSHIIRSARASIEDIEGLMRSRGLT